MPSLHLRPAVPEDAGELLSIYRPYVEHTAAVSYTHLTLPMIA